MRQMRDGLWVRPGLGDITIAREARGTHAGLPVRRGDVVLDIGAHIGVVSRLAEERGARVIAVEADPGTVEVLRRNVRPSTEVIWAAVGPDRPFRANAQRPFLSGATGELVDVPTVTLGTLLEAFRPTVVKCDIEFGEYDLPELRSLLGVRVVAMEVHVRRDMVTRRPVSEDEVRRDRQRAAALVRDIELQGFRRTSWVERQAKTPPAVEDDTGLLPMTKAIDARWEQ